MKIRDILQAILDGKEDDIEIVVRCKDCKYMGLEPDQDGNLLMVCNLKDAEDDLVSPKWFCNYAVRKDMNNEID